MFIEKCVVLVLSLAVASLADVITSSSYSNYATNRQARQNKSDNYEVQVPVLLAARPIPSTTTVSPPPSNGFIPSFFSSMLQGRVVNTADYDPYRKSDDSGSSIDSNYGNDNDNGYDYYDQRQRYYATTPSPVATPKRLYYNGNMNSNNNNNNNHDGDNDSNKFNKGIERDQDQRDYGDYYYRGMQGYNYDNYRDYNIRQQRPPMQYNYRNSQQQQPAPSPPSSSYRRPLENPSSSPPSLDMKNVINRIKFVYDLFVSMNSAWNAVAQQQTKYIKDPKFNMTAPTDSTVKNPKGKSTMASKITTASPLPTTSSPSSSSTTSTPITVGENDTDDLDEDDRETRKRRDSENAVGEARYIKGDPLKGYYDFVITEGSYKFWAAFQVGTAILIIYSTFAAIYYSKVNPLVSDYDYTDYLGGGRSLRDDNDFVDDSEDDGPHGITSSTSTTSRVASSWSDWLPRTGHSLKFILDAIDSLPLQDDGSS